MDAGDGIIIALFIPVMIELFRIERKIGKLEALINRRVK